VTEFESRKLVLNPCTFPLQSGY